MKISEFSTGQTRSVCGALTINKKAKLGTKKRISNRYICLSAQEK